jgi:hypothetical protein
MYDCKLFDKCSSHHPAIVVSLLTITLSPHLQFNITMLRPLLLFALPAAARKVIFPPVSGYTSTIQRPFVSVESIDISTGSAFAGLTTYANLPYVHCLAGEGHEVEKYDIAILGAPFDTVSQFLFRRYMEG